MLKEDIDKKGKFELLQERFTQKPLKPVVVYKKTSGEIVRVLFSSRVSEMQKIDRRTQGLIELEGGVIPRNIQELIVINGILKEKPKNVINASKKEEFESQRVVIEMQLEVAKKRNLKEAAKRYSGLIREINKQIVDLGVD